MSFGPEEPLSTATGAAAIGLGMSWVWRYDAGREQVHDLLAHAWERGIRWVDVSPAYGDAERLLGEFLSEKPEGARVIAKFFGGVEASGWTPAALRRSLDSSLEALGLDSVTAYLIQSNDSRVLSEELLDELSTIRAAGLASAVGVSADADALDSVLADSRLDAFEFSFNLLDQESRDAVAQAGPGGALLVGKRMLANAAWRRTSGAHPYVAEYQRRAAAAFPAWTSDEWLDVAVRFAVYHTPCNVALFSSGKCKHVDAVVDASARGPLDADILARIRTTAGEHPEWSPQF